jgi:hypothetical protein
LGSGKHALGPQRGVPGVVRHLNWALKL